MASALFEHVIELLYRQDRLYRGELAIAGEAVGPAHVISPMLAVYDPRSRVIPPESVIAFYLAAASPRKRLLVYEGDTGVGLAHVGALIGAKAHQKLWPEIFAWVESLSHVNA
jgi:polyhydroxyalkanoate synthase